MTAPPILLTEEQAAARLLISPRTLRQRRCDGMIRYVRLSPRKIAYTPDDLAEYIERQTMQDAPPCPSTNQRKASSGTMTSSSRVTAITEALAARRSATPRDSKPR